ncbi:DUF554 domain-containing protein [Spirochaeta cellobiosiphila]|uniref:DUF554 domain-containing protein n=1 Tax=Spirochaeta cellobiosiphila TaxID=504483 RepID=UPI0004121DC5|nr:DUF554 domain-containing protein [Spirochaeta cellobiosiphila]
MIGPLVNSTAIFTGGIIGFILKPIIPKRIAEGLSPSFALIALSIGVTMLIKMETAPPVVIAIIFGVAIGELLMLEQWVNKSAQSLQGLTGRLLSSSKEKNSQGVSIEFSRQYSALIVLFTMSGMGILGALTEGLSGDYQLLIIKSILDFFTAIIFAMTFGISVSLLFIPQLAFQSLLYFLSSFIMPYMTGPTYANFSACGGVIMIGLGLRMAKIKDFPVVNQLPALLLVIPFTNLWLMYFG